MSELATTLWIVFSFVIMYIMKNIWVLPVNKKYIFESVIVSDCVCDNCWRIVSKYAIIKDSDWKRYNCWLDCADTLQGADMWNYFDYIQNKKELNHYINSINKIQNTIKKWKQIKWVYNNANWYEYFDCYFEWKSLWTINIYTQYKQLFIDTCKTIFWLNEYWKKIIN